MSIKKLCLFIALFNVPFLAFPNNTALVNTKIQFYSISLDIQYDPSMLEKNKHCTSTPCLKRFYKKLEQTNFQVLLDNLLGYKKDLALNDWFFYQLVRKTVEQIYIDERDMHRTSITWFIMTKAGYDTRLYTAKSKFTFLYVRTEDLVYEAPFIKIKDRKYVNLTALYYKIKTGGLYFEIPRYQPGQLNHTPFSFKINNVPALPPMSVEKTYQFSIDEKDISITLDVDTLGKVFLNEFPITDPLNYIQVPISEFTLNSLNNALAPHLAEKSDVEKIQVFVSFTRKAFPYKSDQIKYRRDLPLTADQLMVADSSDFEDRTALFYNLLKSHTDLNFILVQHIDDDIITVGIALPKPISKPFEYNNIQYTICDPTIPSNSSELGIYPINLDKKDIKILEVVNQQ